MGAFDLQNISVDNNKIRRYNILTLNESRVGSGFFPTKKTS